MKAYILAAGVSRKRFPAGTISEGLVMLGRDGRLGLDVGVIKSPPFPSSPRRVVIREQHFCL